MTASNPNVTCATGATFLVGCNGEETDVTALTGSSFSEKYGDMVIQPSNSVVQGTMDDAAYLISNASGAAGWKTGFSIGNHAAYWPIDPMNGILIAAFKGQSATAAAYEGVDFTAVTFSTAALKIQGYTLDQYGRGYSSSPSIATQTGTPTLSSCGTSPAIIGSDRAGTVAMGAGSPTSCTLTFAHAWNGGGAPHCVFTARAIAAGSVAITADSATAETVALSSAFPSFTYMCED